MANEQIIKAWVLQLGLDLEPVAKGVKKTEDMLRKLERVESRSSANRARGVGNQLTTERRITSERQKQDRLAVKRIRAQTAIQAIERRASLGGLSGDALAKVKDSSKSLQASLGDVRTAKEFAFLSRKINRFSADTTSKLKEGNAALAQRNSLLAAQARISDRLDIIRTRARMGGISPEQRDLIGLKAQGIQSSLSGANSEQMRKLAIQTRFLNEETSKYIVLARRQKQAFSANKFAISAMLGPLKNLAAGFLSVYTIMNSVTAIHRTARELDSLKSSLLAASGSAQQAGEDFKYIVSISKQLGVSLSTAAAGYRQIGAAGRQMGWDSAQIQDTFLAATEAARAFGLNADRTGYVYLAFSQILSKGKVSQEELRRQLGEHLPGAMNIAANAMGVTVSELEKMIQAGISAEEFMPKFSAELRKAAREGGALASSIEGITAAEQRLSAVIQQSITEGADQGYRKGIVTFLTSMTRWAEGLRPVLSGLIGLVGRFIGKMGELASVGATVFRGLSSIVKLSDTLNDLMKGNFHLDDTNKKLGLMDRISKGISSVWHGIIGSLELAVGTLELFAQKMSASDMAKQLVGIESQGMKDFRRVYNQSARAGWESAAPPTTSKSVQVINHNTFTGNPEQNAKKMEGMFQNWLSFE